MSSHVPPSDPSELDSSDPAARYLHEYRLQAALKQLLLALAAVHASGRVHCDIKPPNIRVDNNGRLVLLESQHDWPEAFQLPQWGQYLGRQVVALYAGNGRAYSQLRDNWARIRASQLLRASYLALLTYADAGWACLEQACRTPASQRAGLIQEALSYARKLAATKRPLVGALADQMQAQAFVLSGRHEQALTLLRSCEATFRSRQSVYQYPAAYLMGRLLGGGEGRSVCNRALAWATSEGVANPGRWFAMFMPVLRMGSDVQTTRT